MNTGLPYRPPCSGWTRRQFVGGCFQHWRRNESQVPIVKNTTQAYNWRCPDDVSTPGWTEPAFIVPYPQREPTNYGADCPAYSIPPSDPDYCAPGHETHGKEPCGGLPLSEFKACGGTKIGANCFESSGGLIRNQALCQKVGFKNVQAWKSWHGRFGYTSNDPAGCLDRDGDPVADASTPGQTKYVRERRELTGTMKKIGGPGGWWEYAISWVREYLVDKESGIITEIARQDTWTPTNGGDLPMALVHNWLQIDCTCGLFSFSGLNQDLAYDPAEPEGPPYNPSYLLTDRSSGLAGWLVTDRDISNTSAYYKIERQVSVHGDWAWYGSLEVTYTLSDEFTGEDLNDYVKALLAHWDMADDITYPWRRDTYTTVAPVVTHREVPNPVSPSSAVTAWGADPYVDPFTYDADTGEGYDGAVLGAPLTATLGQVSPAALVALNGSTTISPGGENVFGVPGVTGITDVRLFDVDGTTVLFTGAEGTDYTVDLSNPLHCTISVVDGSSLIPAIMGQLIVVRFTYNWDYGGYFDRRHVNHRWVSLGGDLRHLRYYGSWSGGTASIDPSDAVVPRAATQWTDTETAGGFPHGAWTFMIAGGGVLYAQKYAEIKLPWRSQNWFGPCGKQRDEMVGQTCSGDGTDCAYTGGYHRWPDAWPIEGDRTFTAEVDSDPSKVKVTLGTAALYLRVGDAVDFTDEAGTVTVANKTVTDVDAGGLWFKFTGTVPAGARVKSHGAPGYWWYDSDGKGEYVAIEHEFDYRDTALNPTTRGQQVTYGMPREVTGYTVTTLCLRFPVCSPAVMCFSHNYEVGGIDDFPEGWTVLPPDITPDNRFGARWQGCFKQVMDDYWWSAPAPACVPNATEDGCEADPCGLAEDDGSGQTDACVEGSGSKYYAHRPLVEIRTAMPAAWRGDSQPTVQDALDGSGATVTIRTTYRTYSDLQSAGTSGPFFAPADALGFTDHALNAPAEIWTPWLIWLRMQSTICATGRFSDDYKATLGCWMCGAEPA